MVKLSEPKTKKKSLLEGITADFLKFIDSDNLQNVFSLLGESAKSDIKFIIKDYAWVFLDKIRLDDIETKLSKKEISASIPLYFNETPYVSKVPCVLSENPKERIYCELFRIILDVLSMLENKEYYSNDSFAELLKDSKSIIAIAEKTIKKWLKIDTNDDKKLNMILKAYNFANTPEDELDDFFDIDDIQELQEYFKSNLGIDFITDDDGCLDYDITNKIFEFQDIIGMVVDDSIVDFIIPLIKDLQEAKLFHLTNFKYRITKQESDPINDFIYKLNNLLNLGIKREINNKELIGLIKDGYDELQK